MSWMISALAIAGIALLAALAILVTVLIIGAIINLVLNIIEEFDWRKQ